MAPRTGSSFGPATERGFANEAVAVQPLYDKRETARILGVHIRTVEALLARKLLRAARIGNRVRVDPADLARYIESTKLN
jgi:excisionase family DNA binding protein